METLIQQLGDESQMEFLLVNFCDYIIEDPDLRKHFQHLSMSQMSGILRALIKAAFESNLMEERTRNGVVMKNLTLFELGIDTRYFKKLKVHFGSALRNCWIEESLIDSFTQRFGVLESIFEGEGAEPRKSAQANRSLASRFQPAPAAA